MLHYDKDLEFPWSDSISTLMQAGTMLLSSIRKDSISLEVVFLWRCYSQRIEALFKDLLVVGDRRDDGVAQGEIVVLVLLKATCDV